MSGKSGTRLDHDGLTALVGRIYDAALHPRDWDGVLRDLRDITNSSAANLLGVHHEGAAVTLLGEVDVDPQALVEYHDQYASICPRIKYGQRFPECRIFYDAQLGGDRFIDSSEWYAWLAKFDLRYFLAGFLYDHEHGRGVLTLQRTKTQGHVDRQEVEVFSNLLPHLQRAAQIGRRLEHQEAWQLASGEALDRLAGAVVLTDKNGKIVLINKAAKAILDEGDGLSARAGRLAAAKLSETRRLSGEIRRACAAQIVRPSRAVKISRPSGRAPYGLLVAPVAAGSAPFVGQNPGAILIIADPARGPVVDEQILSTMFELTPAEAKLAIGLASGLSVREYAQNADIAVATARVHLRHAMEKTGVRRQSELIRFVLALESVPTSDNAH